MGPKPDVAAGAPKPSAAVAAAAAADTAKNALSDSKKDLVQASVAAEKIKENAVSVKKRFIKKFFH